MKPEVDHLSLRRHGMTEPRPTGNMQKKLGKDRTCSSEDLIVDSQTHRHTNKQTDTVITILRFPIGRGVITFQKLESITISLFLFNKFTVA